jgi:drug/metabolite transporter superfamily protein YnfA
VVLLQKIRMQLLYVNGTIKRAPTFVAYGGIYIYILTVLLINLLVTNFETVTRDMQMGGGSVFLCGFCTTESLLVAVDSV